METVSANKKIEELIRLSKTAYSAREYSKAEMLMTELISLEPGKYEYYSAYALTLKKQNKYKAAEENYMTAIALNPNSAESYYNLGLLFYEQGMTDSAVKNFYTAIELNPGLYFGYYNLGNICRETGEYQRAIEHYQKAINIKNDFSEAYYNLGVVQERLYKYDDALVSYNKAINHNNNFTEAHWNKSLLLLLKGDYKNGFAEYEWRLLRKETVKRNLLKPRIDNAPLEGKTVLVYSEQGLGDTLQFVRYFSHLKKSGCKLIFECDPKLAELLRDLESVDEIMIRENLEEPKIDYDFQIPLLSLPRYFNTTVETIPRDVPYIFPKPGLIAKWKKILDNDNNFSVGIVWAGNPFHVNDKNRSVPLNLFKNLAALPNLSLYSLQAGKSAGETAACSFNITNLNELGIVDFSDTAAVVYNMDLIISVDTSVAHLAGAMGKRVWTLLPFAPDWRWKLEGDNSLWYPTMKLFRQLKPGNWNEVFENVYDELKSILCADSLC